jgi:hypothetical protein
MIEAGFELFTNAMHRLRKVKLPVGIHRMPLPLIQGDSSTHHPHPGYSVTVISPHFLYNPSTPQLPHFNASRTTGSFGRRINV